LVSRETGVAFGDGPVRVYLNCANDENHVTGAEVTFDPKNPPPMHYPGETAPRA
jgi:hypothetical protein